MPSPRRPCRSRRARTGGSAGAPGRRWRRWRDDVAARVELEQAVRRERRVVAGDVGVQPPAGCHGEPDDHPAGDVQLDRAEGRPVGVEPRDLGVAGPRPEQRPVRGEGHEDPGHRILGSERAQVPAAAVEGLDVTAIVVGDVHRRAVGDDPERRGELAVPGPERSPGADEPSPRVELLDPVVAVVGNVERSVGRERDGPHRLGRWPVGAEVELPVARAGPAPRLDEGAGGREDPELVPERVRDPDVPGCRIDRRPPGLAARARLGRPAPLPEQREGRQRRSRRGRRGCGRVRGTHRRACRQRRERPRGVARRPVSGSGRRRRAAAEQDQGEGGDRRPASCRDRDDWHRGPPGRDGHHAPSSL
jgi:hypothetical protein